MNGETRSYTFLLRLTDRPGGMEAVAATFAHRGVSITSTLGHDGAIDPMGRATVLLTFTSTEPRKEALRNALRRLSRVVEIVEYDDGDAALRRSVLIRLSPDAPAIASLPGTIVERIEQEEDGSVLYALFGPPGVVDALLDAARNAGHLRALTYATLAL